jgi:hypothetical protein
MEAAEPDAPNANDESQHSNSTLLDFDLPIPAAVRVNQSHATHTSRPRGNVRAPARNDSSQSFADSAHDPHVSESRVRASTPLPNAPQTAAPRRDSNSHTDIIRKKPRAVIQITSAASKSHERHVFTGIAVDKRVLWATKVINCCAMTSRKASPQVSLRITPPSLESSQSPPLCPPPSHADAPPRRHALT